MSENNIFLFKVFYDFLIYLYIFQKVEKLI